MITLMQVFSLQVVGIYNVPTCSINKVYQITGDPTGIAIMNDVAYVVQYDPPR